MNPANPPNKAFQNKIPHCAEGNRAYEANSQDILGTFRSYLGVVHCFQKQLFEYKGVFFCVCLFVCFKLWWTFQLHGPYLTLRC